MIEKNENRSAVNVGDSDEFAATKMFQTVMDGIGWKTHFSFFPSFSKGMCFPIIFSFHVIAVIVEYTFVGVLQIRLRASRELKE